VKSSFGKCFLKLNNLLVKQKKFLRKPENQYRLIIQLTYDNDRSSLGSDIITINFCNLSNKSKQILNYIFYIRSIE